MLQSYDVQMLVGSSLRTKTFKKQVFLSDFMITWILETSSENAEIEF